ncbi:MAG TPA: SWIM zinc finger family protein [Myxococcota bacterium]
MSVEHAYRYAAPSTLRDGQLRLVVDDGAPRVDARPFFTGRLKQPRLQADLLTAIALLVDTRFFTPPNAKERQHRDPIVTAGAGVLRFEGFSACGSAWIRVDVDGDGYDGVVGHGTTNVDINPPLRQALARVKDSDALTLSVDSGAVVVDHARSADDASTIVEKKVPLPARWLRGLVEVQSYLSSMTERFTVGGAVMLRFLRALPRATTKNTPLYLVDNAGGLRLTATASAGSVRIADVQRLRVLEPLVLRARSVAFFADATEGDGAVAVVLRYAGSTLTLALTADVWRGFSGEGQALRALLRTDTADVLARVRAALSWQHDVDVDALAADLGKPRALIDDTLRVLGASGLVGFDLVTRRWFHRVLPFDLEHIDDFNPRLVAARALVDDGNVTIVAADEARVVGSGGEYRVRGGVGDDARCTCPWFAKHQGDRGPCKHVLAVELARARAASGVG